MSKSTEDVLLVVTNVKVKKCDGQLYVMQERIAWMQTAKQSFQDNSYNYADIKMQKISPDSKDKVQLQIQLHCGKACTFHFANPAGREAQKRERDNVKDLLQQLLPRFKNVKNEDIDKKNKVLTDNVELFEKYKVLVAGKVMTSEEFWEIRKDDLNAAATSDAQEVGVSPAFLADIQPVSDGCNGTRYNLTADIIESIFRTYPTVRERHAEYVPDKLSEREFWSHFFQSHYFHRDRINLASKDLFTECARRDDITMKAELDKGHDDPLIDLSQFSDYSLDEAYGQTQAGTGTGTVSGSNPVNSSLIKRFNQHSSMILKSSCDRPSNKRLNGALANHTLPNNTATNGTPSNKPSTNGVQCSNGQGLNGANHEPGSSKRARLREKLELSDLDTSHETGVNQSAGPSLTLVRTESYLHGPTLEQQQQYNTSDDLLEAHSHHTQDLMSWSNQYQPLHHQSAYKVLQDLNSALLNSTSKRLDQTLITPDLQTELRGLYSALAELLRHFWACFPVTTRELEEKLVRMRDCLVRFEQTKIDTVVSRHQGSSSYQTLDVLHHMRHMLSVAYSKYSAWQNRKQQQTCVTCRLVVWWCVSRRSVGYDML